MQDRVVVFTVSVVFVVFEIGVYLILHLHRTLLVAG